LEDDESLFFANLPELRDFAQVADPGAYAHAPPSAHLIISDVRGSTQAIEAGRYRDVNALGVACIVAVCNATPKVELAYVFGGDGATLLVPGAHLGAYESALRGARRVAREAYGLELRVAIVPVAELVGAGHPVRVARYRASPNVCLAMFAGSGFALAERWVKDAERGSLYAVSADGADQVDFEGFECRWQPVKTRRGSVVSLLVQALSPLEAERKLAYEQALDFIEGLVSLAEARPVSVDGLELKLFGGDYSAEARLRGGGADGPAFAQALKHARSKARIGKVLIALRQAAGGFDGERYPAELVENTDFRKFDETLRMVLDLSESEVGALETYLEAERAAGRIAYGIHRASSALVTCFVRSHAGNHVHFVDGAEGGYALAARQLKAQLKAQLKGAT
jgi:hypothetical protein